MADAFVQNLLDNLNSLIGKGIGLLWGVDKEMKKLSSLLSTIQAVLEDAEEKQVRDKALQNWLRKLKEAAYKVDDILDECVTQASRSESKGQNSGFINKVSTSFLNSLRPDNISFRYKIGNRMREIRERLDEIAEERMKFHLNEIVSERRNGVTERRQTGSTVTQSRVYGRDKDRMKIVQCLVNRVACCEHISIYPIVGLGGLGKTTLAQKVFNDKRVKSHFELRIWVCVSEDFSLKRIIKAIIESASRTALEPLELDPMQSRLQDILKGKRYLLVLDDVWNEDEELWDRLKFVLACGSNGASVIVTTRIKKVASIMGTLPQHDISGLTEDDCWSLFRERAFGYDKEERPNLVALGKEIVKKCAGVPLAVKSLGSLMRYKSEENEWLSVKESELWDLPQDENSILPALRLSYSNLPSNLRQCFVYCAIFPKDYIMDKEMLIQLWMANDFIPTARKLEPEDVGNEICNELYWRSFFEEVYFDNFVRFKMHDLIHDLAQSIMKDECCVARVEISDNISQKIVHLRMRIDLCQSYIRSNPSYEMETLRTLFLLRRTPSSSREKFSCDFSRLSSLRVFHAYHTRLMKLSSSVSHLIHLRHLDLSRTCIQMLPKSICGLLNLLTLKLECCRNLRELPKQMKQLKNLRHLYLNGCYSLSQMPPNIGQITCLKTLTLFVVGKTRGRLLNELKRLNLTGELHIKHLDRVSNPVNAKEANLAGKQNLRQLHMSWECKNEIEQRENVEKVLEALEPHPNLEHLVIEEYKGAKFPLWMRDQILSHVVSIKLSRCENCYQLPLLGKLPSLRDLEVSGMIQVLYIDDNIQGGEMARRFPSLKRLDISDLPNLQRLSRKDGTELFPCLTLLRITNCPKLSLPCLPSVKELDVTGCSDVLLKSILHLGSLTYLSVSSNDDLTHLPKGMLQNCTSLCSLHIDNFTKLKGFTTEPASLSALKSLRIRECYELEYLSEELGHLSSLKRLILNGCPGLVDLPDGIKYLSSLQQLNIQGCPELVDLPDGIKYLSSLRQLTISGGPIYSNGQRNPTGFNNLIVLRYGPEEPINSPKLTVLPEALQHFPALQSLTICWYPHLASLPHWLGDLTSLQSLQIFDCPNLSSLPASFQSLRYLKNLRISGCPELSKRCEKETGEDWDKIAHVTNVYVEPLPNN